MKKLSKSKVGTTLIVFVTLVLAGVAIFTAYRLYQLRQTSVAPNVPSSNPKAEETSPTSNCSLAFTLTTATPTGTATATATASATPTATATATPTSSGEPNSCGGTCGSNSNCASGYYCYNGYCRNPDCPSETDCTCAASTATASATAAALPQSGTNWPTIAGAGLGILVILGSLLLAI